MFDSRQGAPGDAPQAPPRRLRIAVLNRRFVPAGGGAERYAIALVEQLAERHEVHVFAQEIAHQHPLVQYHRVSMPLRKPRWINQLWYATATWAATRHGFDIVHSHENTWHGQVQTVHVLPVWYNFFLGRSGARRALRWLQAATSPRLWTYLGLESLRFRVPPYPVHGQPAKRIMVTSDSLGSVMSQTFPHAAGALTVLVPGVDLPPPITAAQHTAARAQLGLPPAVPCILLVGNDFRKKGLGALLQAVSLLQKEERVSPVVAVVGSREQQAGFAAQAEALGIAEQVHFLGPLEDVGPAYRAADILAHPTLEDTFAMVVLEAMAHGLPVVVSGERHCGIAGLLQDGDNALLLQDPQDATALAQCLLQLLRNPSWQQVLGVRARQFAQQHGWPQKALEQETVYLRLTA